MEFNVKQQTKFDVGDIVYIIDFYDKKVLKGIISDIVLYCHANASKGNEYLYYVMNNNKNLSCPYFEDQVFESEYDAKIALGKKI